MKKTILSLICFLGISTTCSAIEVILNNGSPEVYEFTSVESSTGAGTVTVLTPVISSSVTAVIDQLIEEGFNKNHASFWKVEIEKRLNENYIQKRAREYPSTGDQLDAIWKILNNQEDAQSDAIKAKIAEVKAKYQKPQ